jgi:hypothetical protein
MGNQKSTSPPLVSHKDDRFVRNVPDDSAKVFEVSSPIFIGTNPSLVNSSSPTDFEEAHLDDTSTTNFVNLNALLGDNPCPKKIGPKLDLLKVELGHLRPR